MATSVNLGYPIWLDGEVFSGIIGRTYDVGALAYAAGSSTTTAVRSGVFPSGGTQALQVAASSGMNVTVNPGHCVIANSASAVYGGYRFGNLSQATLTVATSDPTNARIDLVVAHVQDNGDATSYCEVALVTGTAAPIPAAPSVPANGMALAQISVAAGATSIVAGNITDQRVWTVPPGGILPVTTASVAPAGQNGSYVHDLTVGRLAHNGASGVKQMRTLPFAPLVAANGSSNVNSTGTEVTVLSLSATTDGSTDLEIWIKWANLLDTTGPALGAHANMNIYIDATRVDSYITGQVGTDPPYGGGATWYRTTSLLGTTPTAGTHTITWKFQAWENSGHNLQIVGSSIYPMQLMVKPVCL